jgi:hypothetical protein
MTFPRLLKSVLVISGSMLLLCATARAQPRMIVTPPSMPATAPSWETTDALVRDIGVYQATCGTVMPDSSTHYRQCASEKGDLLARQQKLNVTDDTINEKLQARNVDWHWP